MTRRKIEVRKSYRKDAVTVVIKRANLQDDGQSHVIARNVVDNVTVSEMVHCSGSEYGKLFRKIVPNTVDLSADSYKHSPASSDSNSLSDSSDEEYQKARNSKSRRKSQERSRERHSSSSRPASAPRRRSKSRSRDVHHTSSDSGAKVSSDKAYKRESSRSASQRVHADEVTSEGRSRRSSERGVRADDASSSGGARSSRHASSERVPPADDASSSSARAPRHTSSEHVMHVNEAAHVPLVPRAVPYPYPLAPGFIAPNRFGQPPPHWWRPPGGWLPMAPHPQQRAQHVNGEQKIYCNRRLQKRPPKARVPPDEALSATVTSTTNAGGS